MSFPLEEDAFARLDAYLAAIRGRFEDAGAGDEIVGDIEARAAERFGAKNGAVITLADVESLMSAMGSPEELGDDAVQDGRPARSGRRRRLFRNPGDGIVAGVCSGVAAWLGTDARWVRVALGAAVALAILTPVNVFGVVAVIGYVILWAVLPVARTASERMEMRGEPVTLRSLDAALKGRAGESSGAGSRAKAGADGLARLVGRAAGWLFRALGVALAAIGVAVIVLALTVAANLLLNAGDADVRVFSPSIPLSDLLAGWKLPVAAVGGFLAVAIPAFFLFLLGLSLAARKNRFSQYLSFALIGVWIVAVAALATAGVRTGREVVERVGSDPGQQDAEISYELGGFDRIAVADGYRVDVIRGDVFSVRLIGRQERLAALQVQVEDGGILSIAEREPAGTESGICLFCSKREARVEVVMPALVGASAGGGSDVTLQGFESAALAIDARGGSSVFADVRAGEASVTASDGSSVVFAGAARQMAARSSSGGSVYAADARVGDVDAEAGSGSSMTFGSVRRLDAKADGGATVTYDAAEDVDPEVQDGGSVERSAAEAR